LEPEPNCNSAPAPTAPGQRMVLLTTSVAALPPIKNFDAAPDQAAPDPAAPDPAPTLLYR
jgi:hypothetical protein